MALLRPLRVLHCPAARLSAPSGRVCIVGSGPAAFYTAQSLLKGEPQLHVDVLEKLPVPFGLVRYGVAPDHPEVKNVINTFTQVARNPRFRFFGNVCVGTDVTVAQLRDSYSAVVLAYGAAQDRRMDVPGEDLPGVLSARDLVGWYNGLPECARLRPDLSAESVAVVGHGNVALDVARILLSPLDLLRTTDIPDPVLAALAESRVRRVMLVGRRGPLQAAFTIKEVREMLRLPGCGADLRDVLRACPQLQDRATIQGLPRPRRRLTELLADAAASPPAAGDRQWSLHFLRSPTAVLDAAGRASGLRLAVNEFADASPLAADARVRASGREETLACDLVVRSIGYRSERIDPALPWDEAAGHVANRRGHVAGNLFCAGWIKRGPAGVLLSTLSDARETGAELLARWGAGDLGGGSEAAVERVVGALRQGATSFADWDRIDAEETRRGRALGKVREKMTSVDEMLNHRGDQGPPGK